MQIYALGLGDLFERPSLAPSQPCVAPHENHDWSSVGIFKGSSIRRPRKCLFIHILHAGLGWGPEPELRSALFNVAAGLAGRRASYAKGKAEEERRRKERKEMREHICMCETERKPRERLKNGAAESQHHRRREALVYFD